MITFLIYYLLVVVLLVLGFFVTLSSFSDRLTRSFQDHTHKFF